MKFILGTKIAMTQKFSEDGTVTPVTAVQAGPITVTQVKGDKDGYHAVQVGFGRKKHLAKPIKGHLKDLADFRWLKEFKSHEAVTRGQVIDVSTFEVGDMVKVTGWSKGKGFQGVVKRHGFHGSPATHGHKDQLRMPGSIGAGEPQHVFKGKRMAGRMGDEQVTVSKLKIVEIDTKKNILYVLGAVPGARDGLVMIYGEGTLVAKDLNAAPVETETAGTPATETTTEETTEASESTEPVVEATEATPEVVAETPETKVEDTKEEVTA